MPAKELSVEQLYRRCEPEQFSFATTEELEPLREIVAQPRAEGAVKFGIAIRREGFNIFALGPPGTGKRSLLWQFLEAQAPREATPDDWCYVENFEESHKPVALRLPAGRGKHLRESVEQLLEDVAGALSGAFESDEYRARRQALEDEVSKSQEKAFEGVRQFAQERGLKLSQTPLGIQIVPTRDGEPMSKQEMEERSEEQRKEIEKKSKEFEQEIKRLMRETPRQKRDAQRRAKELKRETAKKALEPLFAELRQEFQNLDDVVHHLEALQEDLVENSQKILKAHQAEMEKGEGDSTPQLAILLPVAGPEPLLRKYRVNLLVSHEPSQGAPLIYEDNPRYHNVVGRVEHIAHMGALMADFSLIKPGALHRANGGYLILDARKVLAQPLVWEALKHALRAGEVRIESLGQTLGLISTVSLEPQPIPLDVKVVLIGSRLLYMLLREFDPDFPELFKVAGDFASHMERQPEDELLYARLVATVAHKEKLRPLDRSGVARTIEQASRLAHDAQRLSLSVREVADLLCEADYCAGSDGNGHITAEDVQRAVDAQTYRADRQRELMQEHIARGTLLIETEGKRVGQINGLAVTPFANFLFGCPTRITARTRLGKGKLIDIEREVELGGPAHSKGVLILAGFLAGRYASDQPLSLSASLVIEQSYSDVAGDSASSAELYALLSSIADLPIRQDLAVTGSVNQHGQIQAIGAVNEKIEGFFDTCRNRGLSGTQGVMIPAANVQHLMLRRDVVGAVAEGRFHVHAVETVDEGMELLTGLPAGARDEQGNYPAKSVNGKVEERLRELARQLRTFLPAGPNTSGA
jgi:predicted ATP-dependent protease